MVGGISVPGLLFVGDYVIETVVKDPLRAIVLADHST